jgi:hypothetical protein
MMLIAAQRDRAGAEIGQHYESFNEHVMARVITASHASPQHCARTRGRDTIACGESRRSFVKLGEALAAAGIRRDHKEHMTGGAA